VDQHVGRGIVTDRDHLERRLPHRHPRPGGNVLKRPAASALQRVGDRQFLVPGDLARGDLARERAQDEQLEHRGQRPGGGGSHLVHRDADPAR